jgi:hypothetical protein
VAIGEQICEAMQAGQQTMNVMVHLGLDLACYCTAVGRVFILDVYQFRLLFCHTKAKKTHSDIVFVVRPGLAFNLGDLARCVNSG